MVGALAIYSFSSLTSPVSADPLIGYTLQEYSLSSDAQEITVGSDGNLWVAADTKVDKVSLDGTITEYPYQLTSITSGPDGNLWGVVDGQNIARITTEGVMTNFYIGVTGGAFEITAGSDGNLWFTTASKLYRMTTEGTYTSWYLPHAGASLAQGIATGPDGNIWYTRPDEGKIGVSTLDGQMSEFALPSTGASPFMITAGPDGNMWFTEWNQNKIGKITMDGQITEFSLPSLNDTFPTTPLYLTFDNEGYLWYTVEAGNTMAIGRMSQDGQVSTLEFTPDNGSRDIVYAPDGHIWITEPYSYKIAKVIQQQLNTDLTITITDNKSIILPLQRTNYQVSISNLGPSAVANATVNVTIPTSIQNITWICNNNVGVTCNQANGTGNNITMTVNLAANSNTSISIQGRARITLPKLLRSTASIEIPAGINDTNLANNDSSDRTLLL